MKSSCRDLPVQNCIGLIRFMGCLTRIIVRGKFLAVVVWQKGGVSVVVADNVSMCFFF